MSGLHRFLLKFCRNGHILYSTNEISQIRCETCGECFIESCEHCGTKLLNSFTSRIYFTSGKPISFPKRPEFCRKCGKPYAWTPSNQTTYHEIGLWSLFHPTVTKTAKSRFESGHHADAVEAILKEINTHIKKIVLKKTENEFDGANLMQRAFSVENPIIKLADLNIESGKNIQKGYMQIFAGVMTGIRNPKAHENVVIDERRAIHFLFLASLLLDKIDESSY